MSKARAVITPDPEEVLLELFRRRDESDASLTKTQKWNLGWYNIEPLAQDQVVIKINQGSKIDTYRGLCVRTNEDSQSDLSRINSAQLTPKDIGAIWKWGQVIKQLEEAWKSERSKVEEAWKSECCKVEEAIESAAVMELVEEPETDIVIDDVSQLSPDELVLAIMQPEVEIDMPRLREMIFVAEDTGFTVEQSERLSPWLLDFAQEYRNSDSPEDKAPVWSAIRTGASMLCPDNADCLFPLLEPGSTIETSMVAVKMLGRIFAAQPPTQVDEHQSLANEIFQMAESFLNRYAIASSNQNAAMAQLAIYALAAMASSRIDEVVKKVRELNIPWFTQQTLQELCDLASMWESHTVTSAEQPQKLLNSVIQAIEG